MRKIVSLIPARGGSKGIYEKNIKPVNSEPMLFHTVRASLLSHVHETWVSSDSKVFRHMCKQKFPSCYVQDRPEEYATDEASTESVMEYFTSQVDYDIIVLIQPTSPMLTERYINMGINMVEHGGYDSVFSAVKTNDMLIWSLNQKHFPESGYTIIPINYHPRERGRRQDRERHILIETGGFYVTTRKMFEETQCRIGGKIGYVEVPFWESFQVDGVEDLKNINKLMRKET